MDYGGDLALVVKKTVAGKEFHCINRHVARRYFPGEGAFVPEPRDQTFQVKKGPRTKRIFCLGESTMAGFPYDFHVAAPSFLADRLQHIFPDDTIEVIDVGLSAVGSYVILDFINELVAYEPDLFIVQLGHNEFYGIYGPGSSLAPQWGSGLTHLSLKLLSFKTYLLARNLYASWRGAAARPSGTEETLMEHVVGEGVIPYGSSLYAQGREAYRENLGLIIAEAQSHGVPIMCTALVSNLRTHAPFQSVFAAGTSAEQRSRVLSMTRAVDSMLALHDPAHARALSERALAIDSTYALTWFGYASATYALGDYVAADYAYRRARDFDALRFRATDDFQRLLSTVCGEHHVPVARVDSAFDAASPNGIVGSELMMEHLHPNIRGYFLMGKVMAEAIRDAGLLFPAGEWTKNSDLTDSQYFDLSTVSEFDSLCGAIRVALLMQHWPFAPGGGPATYRPETPEAAIAYSYVTNAIAWQRARYDMASQYEREKKYALACRECLAVAKAAPHSYEPLLRAADYSRMGGGQELAERYYRLSYLTENNPFAPLKLAMMLLEQGRNNDAADQLTSVLDLERRTRPRLDAQATSTVRYLLALAQARMRNLEEARGNVRMALQIDPRNADALNLQQQLDVFDQRLRRSAGTSSR
jgi:tetratricopeptide (TPR) repeat protein